MDIFKIIGSIIINNSSANEEIDDTTNRAQWSSEQISNAFTKAGEKSIELGKSMAVMSASAGVALGGMIKSAASVKAMNSQFEQTFEGVTDKATAAMQRISEESGIIETRLKGVGTSIYAFAKTTGMETPEALGMMERALKVTADSAAYYDRSLEDTSESLKSFLKGNFENDAALGLSCTETTRNTAANELYGKSFIELSEAQKQMTLLKMVEDANRLSGAMGQAARESDGWENVIGNLKEAITQLAASIGEVALPIATKFVQKATEFVQRFQDMSNGAKVFIVALLGIVAAASPVLIVTGNLLKGIGRLVIGFDKSVKSINAARVALKNYELNTASASKATGLAAVAVKAKAAADAVATSRTWAFVVANRAALVAALGLAGPIALLAGYMLKTGTSADEMATMITSFADKLANGIVTFANQLPELINRIVPVLINSINMIIPPLVASLPSIITAICNAIVVLAPALMDAGVTLFMALVKAIPKVIGALVAALPKIVNAVRSGLASGLSRVWDSIKKTASTKWNSITNTILKPVRTLQTKIKGIVDKIKGFFNFKVKAPKIPVPKFAISPSGWKLGDLLKGKIPKLRIAWHAEGGIFNKPTIFETAKGLHGVGEAGAEAITPISKLQQYVSAAVSEQNKAIVEALRAIEQNRAYSFNLVTQLDGRTIAVSTAKYTQEEINKLQMRDNRLRGVRV